MNTGVATPRPARTWVIFSFLSASVLCAALVAQPSFAESLTTSAQQQVLASTFEVVQLKPDEGAVTYERALPMELIPYQQRIDKYRSIGTAFAIGGNRYVTAAHVFLLGFGSQFGPPALRDTTGEVYAIAKVLKYSQEQDFVEFSLQHEPKSPQSLTIGTAVLNDPVFAVGNALGQGIVIRDGVFTSETPEEREGRWKWLRFSAAASPGNSGGPLVDKDGKVLGVVLRKSQNENLNMAAPIKLVTDAPESEALIEDRNTVRFAIMDASELVDVHERIPLPATPEKVFAALLKIEAAVSEREDHQYREHYKDRLFPNGSSSQALLHEVLREPFPHRIQERQGDRVWVAAAPKEPQVAQLDHNGYVRYGGGGIRLRAPDDVKLATLYGDSKLFMDMLLRTSIPLKRPVGSDSVKVTSLGKAREEFSYTDAYGRVWQFRVWAIPFDDSYVIVDSLPTPEGSVSHLTAGVSGLKDNLIRSQEFLTNFTWVTYEGTLSRWREYLALKGVQPQVFSKLTLTVDPDYKRVQFHSKRYDLSLGSDVVALTSDAVLSMNFSFFTDGTGVVWDVGGMAIGEGTGRPNFFDISRFVRPDAALPEGFQNNWSKIVAGDFPFNAKATDVNGGMRITMVAESPAVAAKSAPSGATGVVKVSEKGTAEKSAAVTPGAAPAAGAAQGGDVRYVLSVGNEGQPGQDAMQAKLDALNKAFKPLEQ